MSDPRKIIKRFFGELEVRELDATLILRLTAQDLVNAVRNDPANCALSRCAQRAFGSTGVLFYTWVAYIDLPDENNVMYVARAAIAAKTKALVKRWDEGGEMPLGAYYLVPPTHAMTLDRQVERRAAAKAAKTAKAAAGEPTIVRAHPRRPPRVMASSTVVRNGSGQVHLVHQAA